MSSYLLSKNVPMKQENILVISQKERQRHNLIKMLMDQWIALKQAPKTWGISYRHAKRLEAGFKTTADKSDGTSFEVL